MRLKRLKGVVMLELLVAAGMIGVMAKIADADGQSAVIWGAVTLGLIVLSMFIPMPFLRLLAAGIAAFALMIVVKVMKGSQA